jgi:hypothetical protein
MVCDYSYRRVTSPNHLLKPSLAVVRVALFAQNFSVMMSAASVGVALHLEAIDSPLWHGPLRHALEASIIGFAILAQLASIGYKISIEKDWIVVVAQGNKAHLASEYLLCEFISLIEFQTAVLYATN